MAYREVSVIEVREVLRAWLSGAGLRTVAALAGLDRKTRRRYVQAAEAAGVVRDGGLAQLSDEVLGAVVSAVRPVRPAGHGSTWHLLLERRDELTALVDKGLTVVKIGELLSRRGVVVPYRTLHRFCVQCCGFGRGGTTVRVADGEPGHECQVDFGKLGLVHDAAAPSSTCSARESSSPPDPAVRDQPRSTKAGQIRIHFSRVVDTPHARGGDPRADETVRLLGDSSPRTWG